MNVFFKLIYFGLFLTFGVDIAHGQSPHPITISVDRSDDGEPTFYAHNSSPAPYTVGLILSNIRFSVGPSSNPYYVTAEPGRTQILTLYKTPGSNKAVRYIYRYNYRIGCIDTEPVEDIEYLLPVAEGKSTSIFYLSYIGKIITGEERDDFYSLGFTANPDDDVFAARGGIVTEVVNDQDDSELNKLFSSYYNYVQVVHEDCTFAIYRHLKKGSITVQSGDKIYAGEPIGKVAERDSTQRSHFRFLVNYRNPDFEEDDEESNWIYMIPKFRTKSFSKTELQPDKKYQAIHPEKIITQEMGWFERRRWKKRNR